MVKIHNTYDYIIIGGGIAGLSAGYELSAHGRVLVLDMEGQPGYHSTGRSGAIFTEAYGTPLIRALSKISRSFYETPPTGFSDHPLLTPRGCLVAADENALPDLKADFPALQDLIPTLRLLEPKQVLHKLPVLNQDYVAGALWEPNAMDMDVHAIMTGYLKALRVNGGFFQSNTKITDLTYDGNFWTATTPKDSFSAPLVVNAAGGWADVIGKMAGASPIGLIPKRRTAILFAPPADQVISDWPFVVDYNEKFYFKPDAGKIMASCADETPVPPCDIQPEELDIAITADHIINHTSLQVRRIDHSWAGLRSFVADKQPVVGFDNSLPNFMWLAGQGGTGIIAAPALAKICLCLITGTDFPRELTELDITAPMLSPTRCQTL